MFRESLDENGITQMYDIFKKELTELMNDIQNEQGDMKQKNKLISLLHKITSLLITYRETKKKILYVE